MIIRELCARHGMLEWVLDVSYSIRTGRSALQTRRRATVSRCVSSFTESGPPEKTFWGRPINLTAPELQETEAAIRDAGKTTYELQDEFARFRRRLDQLAGKRGPVDDFESRRQERRDRMRAFFDYKQSEKEARSLGSLNTPGLYPDSYLKHPLAAAQITLPHLLAAQTHLGHATALWHPGNSSYIFGIRNGIHIISLEITLAYLRRACRVISEVARAGGLILFIGTRPGFRDIVVKAANLSNGYHLFDRWTPGSLTNGQQILGHCRLKIVDAMDNEIPKFTSKLKDYPVARPDLVVCLNPLENEVCLHECGLYNVPTVGIVDTDTNSTWVTYPIPANDDSLRSVTLITMAMGIAGKEGQEVRLAAAAKGQLTYQSVHLVEDFIDTAEDQDVDEGGSEQRDPNDGSESAAMDDELLALDDDVDFDEFDEEVDENLDEDIDTMDADEDSETLEGVNQEPDDADLEQLEREIENMDRNLQNLHADVRIDSGDAGEDLSTRMMINTAPDGVGSDDNDEDFEALDAELAELDQDLKAGPQTIEVKGQSKSSVNGETGPPKGKGREK